MQLEDVTLKATRFPTEVTVTAKDTQVGAMTQLTVTACYADGTQVVLEDGFTVSVSDEKIAKSAGRNLVGVAPGAVTVTVQAQVAGKSYTAQCQITVTGEEAPQTPVVIQPEEPGNWYLYPIIAVAVLIAAAVVVILIKKKRS